MPLALLLHNPAARNAPGAELLRDIEGELARCGFAVEVTPSQKPGHMVDLARRASTSGCDRVVVCGGDGSVREAAEGLFGSQVPLGIVPLGTANVLAYEMGLPVSDPRACAAIAGRGQPLSVGLGTVGGRAFTFSASCGLDSLAVGNVSLYLKEKSGGFAYGAAALQSLLEEDLPLFDVETEAGERVAACQVFAARARHYAGQGIVLSSLADLKSPTMRLIVLPPPLYKHLGLLPRFLGEGLDGAPDTICREVRAFRLHGTSPLPIQADGDLMPGVDPEFVSHADALRLVFPA
jgi:diacylglycerol kinase (ATP)